MVKKYLILFIALFFAAKYYLGANVPLPCVVNYTDQTNEVCTFKHKLSKEVNAIPKVYKSKYKVRYKASEIKFSLNTFSFQGKTIFHVLEHIGNCALHIPQARFHYLVKLRGPPIAV